MDALLPRKPTARRAVRGALIAALTLVCLPSLGWPARAASGDAATRALSALGAGAVAWRRGRLADACRWFRRATLLTPTWGMAQLELGRCLRLVGDPANEASARLERAASLMPGRAIVRLEQARLAEDQGAFARARRLYLDAGRRGAARRAVLAGVVRVGARDPDRGAAIIELERLRRFIRWHPASLAARHRLAAIAERLGLLDEAQASLESIVASSHARAAAIGALGRFGERHHRLRAIDAARRAADLDRRIGRPHHGR